MTLQAMYSNLRNKLASLLARVIDESKIVVITCGAHERVVIARDSELFGILETGERQVSPGKDTAMKLIQKNLRSRELRTLQKIAGLSRCTNTPKLWVKRLI